MNMQYNASHRGYSIMANENLGYNPKIMDEIIDCIEGYTSHYSRTCIINFGLNYPQSSQHTTNAPMQEFIGRFKKHLDVRGLRPVYFWVREQCASDNPHYHCLLLLDGRKIQNHFALMEEAKRLWGSINRCSGSGLVHYANDCKMLRTDSSTYEQDIGDSIFHASYLAKTNTKNHVHPRQREFSYSYAKPWSK